MPADPTRFGRTLALAALLATLAACTMGPSRGPATPPALRDAQVYVANTPEFTLFSNYATNRDAVIIDRDSHLVHAWSNAYPNGSSVYAMADGSIIRAQNVLNTNFLTGGTGGRIERLDWDSRVLWSFDYSSPTHCQHHDIEPLPNGNILLVAWNVVDREAALANGREPILTQAGGLWADTILEIRPVGTHGGEIVWQWNVMDHLVQEVYPDKPNHGVVAEHPELVNFNHPDSNNKDWLHINAIDYHAELDQILVSSRHFSEVWVIDHSTTTAEAAAHAGGRHGRGGDLLYRWGNPAAYGRGTKQDQVLGGQHNATWIPAGYPGEGNILVFNNGIHRKRSSIDEIIPPLLPDGSYALPDGKAYGPERPAWTYDPDPPFYAWHISGAQRLHDGNTLVCEGYARKLYEITPSGQTVWDFTVPGTGAIFRATRVYLAPPGR